MDPRLLMHFFAEAEGVHRQNMARMAQSVAAGFSDRSGFQQFIDKLELDTPISKVWEETWKTMYMVGGRK